jgi:hypothetical protein
VNKREKNQTSVRKATLVVSFTLQALLLIIVGAGTASAHPLGYDSVDGDQIIYKDKTRYNKELNFAVRQWNELGSVSIEKGGNRQPGTDLVVRDYRNCKDGLFGYYEQKKGADVIGLNSCTLNKNKYDAVDRRGTVVHEMGHALGLADNNLCNRSIMCGHGQTPFDTPQKHDVHDYYRLWPPEEEVSAPPASSATSIAPGG